MAKKITKSKVKKLPIATDLVIDDLIEQRDVMSVSLTHANKQLDAANANIDNLNNTIQELVMERDDADEEVESCSKLLNDAHEELDYYEKELVNARDFMLILGGYTMDETEQLTTFDLASKLLRKLIDEYKKLKAPNTNDFIEDLREDYAKSRAWAVQLGKCLVEANRQLDAVDAPMPDVGALVGIKVEVLSQVPTHGGRFESEVYVPLEAEEHFKSALEHHTLYLKK